MPRPTYAEVNLAAIRANCRAVKSRLAPGVRLMAVVKADAYGHGAVPAAQALQEAGADAFGVALVEEGVALRVAGLARPILVMGIAPAEEVLAALEYDLALTADCPDTARQFQRQAEAHGRRLRVHLKIDTGMGRLGVRAEDAPAAAAALARLDRLVLEGAYTHFACADGDAEDSCRRQLWRLRGALEGMRAAGAAPLMVHAANSSALVRFPETHFDMVRSGLALYGIRSCPDAARVDLCPALSLKTRVVHLKRVLHGEGVSYGHRWTARRDSLVGVLPIGYADGYPRLLTNRGQARVEGRLCPVVGAVCMDSTMVDLTDVPAARAGLEAALIEADHDSPISAEAVAAACSTIPYEILTGIAARVPRVYV